MSIKRLIFKSIMRVSKSKQRFGTDIYTSRSNFKLLGKIVRFFSKMPKDTKPDVSLVDGIKVLRLIPQNKSSGVILCFYGGGFIMDLDSVKDVSIPFGSVLAKATSSEVWFPECRPAPERSFPLQGEESLIIYMTLLHSGVNPKDITLLGAGSGAALAISLAFTLRDRKIPMPSSIVTISAWTDLAMTADSIHTRGEFDSFIHADNIRGFFNHYLQGADPRNPYASPLYGDFTGLPPMCMVVGSNEVFYDDSIRVAEKAKLAGVDVTLDVEEGMFTGYPFYYGFFEEGELAINRMASFINSRADTSM